MDPLTHGLLGSNIGQSLSSKRLTLKTIIIAGLVAMFPDIDIFFNTSGDPLSGLVLHRGITHSLFFGPVIGPLFGFIISRFSPDKEKKGDFIFYSILCFFALESHVLLDLCTSYGTQIFAPFSTLRMAINVVAVIDPLYTVPLLVSLCFGLYYIKKAPGKAVMIGRFTFLLTTGLLFIFYHINEVITETARASLRTTDQEVYTIKSYPTLLQPFYRRVTAESHQQQCLTYISVFHTKMIQWKCYPKEQHWAIDAIKNTPEGRIFKWFAMDQVRYEVSKPTSNTTEVIMSDWRYGNLDGSSLWDIRQTFNDDKTSLEKPQYHVGKIDIKTSILRDIWHATFG
ncbi:MAG: metal-dependent hydrolase [Candidatus Nucleicultricaceae bacterium]